MRRRSPMPPRCALIPLFAVLGCGPGEPPLAQTSPPVVTVSQPVQRTVADYDEYTGRTAAVETVEVRARVRGHLVKVAFQDGEIVQKDSLLFEIDPRPYEASLEQAKAQLSAAEATLKLANAEYARVTQLVSRNAASREELDVLTGKRGVATADINKARAAVDEAKLNLEFTKITAPITGRISRPLVTVGNLVNAGGGDTLLTTIVSVDPMFVYFDVDERSLLEYLEDAQKRSGAAQPPTVKEAKIPVEMAVATEKGFPRKGTIDFVENRVDAPTGTIQARGVFPNKDGFLKPGMFVRLRVSVTDPSQALLVADRAVGTDQGLKYLYVVNGDGVVERRDVTLGKTTDDGLRIVQTGLKKDDWVIVNGVQRARPGLQVEAKQEPMPTPAVAKD